MNKTLILAIALCFFSARSESTQFEIATVHNNPAEAVFAEILKEIYSRLDINVVFIALPGKRALAESSSGRLDAEAQRIYEIGELYPTLIRVPTSFISWEIVVFSKKPDFKVSGWNSLQGYSVAMVRGVKHAELNLIKAGIVDVATFSDVGEMMSMLERDYVDFAIASYVNGRAQLKILGFNTIKPNRPLLNEIVLYHYLHIKHKDLIPKLDEIIKTMKRNGELEQLKEHFSNKLLNDLTPTQ